MKEYEDMATKIGDKVGIEINKVDSSVTFRQHQQAASAMKKSFPFYYFIPAQILIVIVEDIVTLVVIMILYKINSIRTFNVQLTSGN